MRPLLCCHLVLPPTALSQDSWSLPLCGHTRGFGHTVTFFGTHISYRGTAVSSSEFIPCRGALRHSVFLSRLCVTGPGRRTQRSAFISPGNLLAPLCLLWFYFFKYMWWGSRVWRMHAYAISSYLAWFRFRYCPWWLVVLPARFIKDFNENL